MTRLIKRASAEARAFQRGKPSSYNGSDKLKPSRAKRGRAEFDDEFDGVAVLDEPRKPRFAPVTFSEERGVRYLHFGTEWVQGAMRLSKPYHIELEYAQQMMAWLLFLETPKRIVQLGLGTGALTKFAHRFLPRAHVEAVELNPAVIVAARSMFELPPDDARLTVHESDAWDFVNDPKNRGAIGALQIDLYDATARGPVLDSVAFYRAVRGCLADAGIATINLFGDHPSFVRNMKHLNAAFGQRVIALPEVHDGNRIALAFSGPALSASFAQLTERAKLIEADLRLPARSWVKGLKASLGERADVFTI
ncbi:spermidine synthase [Burkholderia oklahomensis]|uniref:Methyltransferase domain protein n=1 Tax=Burkholderia oklahomensis TaxID=342113 RepID=A0AAI8B9L3_9BURK|nr:spermidine synthase [Burkholderia oklahomensis]AIO68257.1 methyltransferase domain protein [Burkholderia oklahomensis]AOI43115.1 spermidine synthase [Burkholderia oklahomensis EO147]KUY57866.1 spermidine synthase [Burkholderia oklahomensis EO147]QPS37857.1 spermidine synthase [Burkholderia oklahomensis]